MKVIDLPIAQLKEAPWNTNQMDAQVEFRLKESIRRFGIVSNMVVRKLDDGNFEVLSGNHRLRVLVEMGFTTAPCVIIEVDDAHARLLAQALNRIHGEDDLGLRAEALKQILTDIPEAEVLSILPETAVSLKSFAAIGTSDIADYLQNWEKAQAIKLKHLQFQLTDDQNNLVKKALAKIMPLARENQGDSPNVRGTALYLLCKKFLERRSENE